MEPPSPSCSKASAFDVKLGSKRFWYTSGVRALVCTAACMLVACPSTSSSLRVDLRTDLVPGLEFDGVVTTLEDSSRMDHVVVEQDYFGGVQVARFDDLDDGSARLTVQLTRDGEVIVERLVRAEVRGTSGVTVLVTRNCRGVACPIEGGDPVAETCVGGRCVDPGCTEETPELCEMACATAEDCPGTSACARPVCEGSACTAEPIPDACPAGMVCDPEQGCVDPACGSCNDSNACTADSCVDGTCANDPLDGMACGPGTCEMDRCVVRTDSLGGASLPYRATAAAVSGDFAALGMLEIDTVQLYRLVDGTWERDMALSPGDDGFGCRIDMHGDLLAILSCAETYSLSLWRKSGDGYAFEARLPYADVVPLVDETLAIARPIAVGDEVAVAGVGLQDGGGGVAVWENDGAGTWSQTDFLDAGEPSLGFGLDVNGRIIAAAPGLPGEAGTVVIFERGASAWEEIHRVSSAQASQLGATVWAFGPSSMRALGTTSPDQSIFKIDEGDDEWGFSTLTRFRAGGIVELGGSFLVIGRPSEDVGGIAEAGYADLAYFGIRVRVREPFPTAQRGFGTTVATDGSTIVIAPFPMDVGAPVDVTFVNANDLESTVVE